MFKRLNKLILFSFFIGFALVSVILPACEFAAHPENTHVNYQHAVQHCPMEQLGQVAANLDYLQQLNKALPGLPLKWQYMLITVVFGLLINTLFAVSRVILRFFLYFKEMITRHMKPWDHIQFAFTQGLIHSKHLD